MDLYENWQASCRASGGMAVRMPSGSHVGELACKTLVGGVWSYSLAPLAVRLADGVARTEDQIAIGAGKAVAGVESIGKDALKGVILTAVVGAVVAAFVGGVLRGR